MASINSKMTVLILAGRRQSESDPLKDHYEDHKAFIDLDGIAMIDRVVAAIVQSNVAENIVISGPEELKEKLLTSLSIDRPTTFIASENSPAATIERALSVLTSEDQLLVTTCDHALLSEEMISTFLANIDPNNTDVAAACVTQQTIEQAFPDAKRTYVKLKDLTFSGANLFWLRKASASPLINFWRGLEENRKNPAKMASQVGFVTGALYLAGRLSKTAAQARLKSKTGVRVDLVPIPIAEAAIDVDKPEDIILVRSILDSRKSSGA